jgi:hypothetical protein
MNPIINWDTFPDWRIIFSLAVALFFVGLFLWNPSPILFTGAVGYTIVPIVMLVLAAAFGMRFTPAGVGRQVSEAALLFVVAALLLIPIIAGIQVLATRAINAPATPIRTTMSLESARTAQPQEAVLHVPPNGISTRVDIPWGGWFKLEKGPYRIHNVYWDKSECVITPNEPCARDDTKQFYLENLGDEPMDIPYEYVRE